MGLDASQIKPSSKYGCMWNFTLTGFLTKSHVEKYIVFLWYFTFTGNIISRQKQDSAFQTHLDLIPDVLMAPFGISINEYGVSSYCGVRTILVMHGI